MRPKLTVSSNLETLHKKISCPHLHYCSLYSPACITDAFLVWSSLTVDNERNICFLVL